MTQKYKFDRLELAGSLGDIGPLLPIAIAMVLSTGALLISGGVKFMIGTSKFQALQNAAEPSFRLRNNRNTG